MMKRYSKLDEVENEIVETVAKLGAVHQSDAALCEESSALQTLTVDTVVPQFTWRATASVALVLDLIDGDTISVALYDRNEAAHNGSNGIVQLHVRLYGIDTPEKRPRVDDPNRVQIKRMAADATAFLRQLLCLESDSSNGDMKRRLVTLCFLEHDKYGRPLALIVRGKKKPATMQDAWLQSVNKQMIDNGLALPYTGGTKWSFDDALQHYQQHRRDIVGTRKAAATAADSHVRDEANDGESLDAPLTGPSGDKAAPTSFWRRLLQRLR